MVGVLAEERPREAEVGSGKARLESVDLLRGAVMVLMALDHVRDYFMNIRLDPTDLSRASAALFLTRWVTHFCAPVFMFLAGAGAYLSGKPRPELARFLATRGLWLIILEETLSKYGMFFNLAPWVVMAVVLWALGWSMIVLAALVYLPRPAIVAFGVATVALHNMFDGVRAADLGRFAPLWRVLHEPGQVQFPGGLVLAVMYPLVPWVGVMALGYAFGPWLSLPAAQRRRKVLALGLALIAAFVALRAANVYGDPRPWSPQRDALFTLFSFLNCQKYPPSLLFLLMTLGPALVALALLDRGLGPLGRPLRTLGRVPLFFWLMQWPVAHGLAVAVNAARGVPVGWMFAFPPFQSPPGYGYGLPTVYLMWVVALLILYPMCHWFAELKRRRRDPWLSYL
jgi:uncharacterized membrane protein